MMMMLMMIIVMMKNHDDDDGDDVDGHDDQDLECVCVVWCACL